jgi:hypothetical protein
MPERICSGCGNGPLDLRSCYHEVKGYERDRAAGGTNAVALRERTGKIMCPSCVEKLKRGIDPTQARLI